nr:immunoglobulin light chain junction region [Macaca mulatta]
CKHYYNTPYSF